MPKLVLKIGAAQKFLRIQCYLDFQGRVIRHCPKWCHIWCPGSLRPYSKVGDFSKRSWVVRSPGAQLNQQQKSCSIPSKGALLTQLSSSLFWFYWVKPLRRSTSVRQAFSVDFWIFKCVLRYCACDKKVLEKMWNMRENSKKRGRRAPIVFMCLKQTFFILLLAQHGHSQSKFTFVHFYQKQSQKRDL